MFMDSLEKKKSLMLFSVRIHKCNLRKGTNAMLCLYNKLESSEFNSRVWG